MTANETVVEHKSNEQIRLVTILSVFFQNCVGYGYKEITTILEGISFEGHLFKNGL